MKQSVTAVLDVGKTNKKIVLFDANLKIIDQKRRAFDAVLKDGLEVEDTAGLKEWMKDTFREFSGKYNIRGIGITTHGATVALLDKSGELAHPVISYTCPAGAGIANEFFATYGDERKLHSETCTADFGFINVGKILHFMKTRLPEAWKKAECALMYPQYFAYLLTGEKAVEPTYLGNHTYLWDFAKNSWSSVAKTMGADKLFPSRKISAWDCIGTVTEEWVRDCGLSPDCKVSAGIHDSNASILPYFARGYKGFTLNSTGTWCVGMRTADTALLRDDELSTKTFFNLDAFSRPLKTVIFLGGMEREKFLELAGIKDSYDMQRLMEVVARNELFLIPGFVQDGAIFPGSRPRLVMGKNEFPAKVLSPEHAALKSAGAHYSQALNLSLALQTKAMLKLLGALNEGDIFVEGGFMKNSEYNAILAALCPNNRIATTDLTEATSFGAAMTVQAMIENISIMDLSDRFNIGIHEHKPADLPGLQAYENRFFELALK